MIALKFCRFNSAGIWCRWLLLYRLHKHEMMIRPFVCDVFNSSFVEISTNNHCLMTMNLSLSRGAVWAWNIFFLFIMVNIIHVFFQINDYKTYEVNFQFYTPILFLIQSGAVYQWFCANSYYQNSQIPKEQI